MWANGAARMAAACAYPGAVYDLGLGVASGSCRPYLRPCCLFYLCSAVTASKIGSEMSSEMSWRQRKACPMSATRIEAETEKVAYYS